MYVINKVLPNYTDNIIHNIVKKRYLFGLIMYTFRKNLGKPSFNKKMHPM